MFRFAMIGAACVILGAVSPASAELLKLHDVTADGAWDCKDSAGAPTGTIVVVEKAYAMLNTDGRLTGYGTLFRIDEGPVLPMFAVINGPLKDVKSQGLVMRGPRDTPFVVTGELFLNVGISTDGSGALDWDCARR